MRRIQFVLDDLPEVTKDRRPTFTFAHIVAPHHPFVFGEKGEDVSPQARFGNRIGGSRLRSYATAGSYREGYRRQAIYLTQQIEQTIDRILARSPEPPIIILQSDHGSGLRHHLNDLELTDLRERMSILNCYYFPERNYEGLYPRSLVGQHVPPGLQQHFWSQPTAAEEPQPILDV